MTMKLKMHYITGAAKNATESLMMAMQLWVHPKTRGRIDGVQELVELINASSIRLRKICEHHEYEINSNDSAVTK